MSWNNYRKYNPKKWKDDDICTWAWNIDHIIPQSDIPYTSMEESKTIFSKTKLFGWNK